MAVSGNKELLLRLLAGEQVVGGLESELSRSFLGAEFDSRSITGGELFIALPGEHSHGNQFIESALKAGASLALAEGQTLSELNLTADLAARVVLVRDSLAAFWKLAAFWREQLNLPTIAVTGSVGKTTFKEMLASLLAQLGRGCYSLKSHNNQVGVPYTICRSSSEDKWLVLEIGMNHRGEIKPLSLLAKPDVAVVTALAPAHIGNLGSLQAIADEKLDIAAGLKPNGSLLLNADSDLLCVKKDFTQRVEYYSSAEIIDYTSNGLEGFSFKIASSSFKKMQSNDHESLLEFEMSAVGRHNAVNALGALKASKLLFPNLQPAELSAGLASFNAPEKRLNLKQLNSGVRLIDDSYNANPSSMRSSLELSLDLATGLAQVQNREPAFGVIIGDMLELGEFSQHYHLEIGQLLKLLKPSFVLAVGQSAVAYLSELPKDSSRYRFAETAEQAIEFIQSGSFLIFDVDLIVVKASRSVGLDKIVDILLAPVVE